MAIRRRAAPHGRRPGRFRRSAVRTQQSARFRPREGHGHRPVHLHVRSLADAERFYVGALGFELMQRYGPSALFVSAGGYHHHIGLNTWAGVGAPPPPPGAIGLRHFVVKLPAEAARADVAARLRSASVPFDTTPDGLLVHDPAGNAILFAL